MSITDEHDSSFVDPAHRGSHEHLDDGGDLADPDFPGRDPQSPIVLADIARSLQMITNPHKAWRDFRGTGRAGQTVTLQPNPNARGTLCDVTFPEPRSFTLQVQLQGGTFQFLQTGFPALPAAANTIPFVVLVTYGSGAGFVQTFFQMRAAGITIPVHASTVRADILATAAWTGAPGPLRFSATIADEACAAALVTQDVDLSPGFAISIVPDFAEAVSIDAGQLGAGGTQFAWVDSQATQFGARTLTPVPAAAGTNGFAFPFRWPVPNRAIAVALTNIGPGGPTLVELAFHVRG